MKSKSNFYIICKSSRLNVEQQDDLISITNVTEKLDIETMLLRAQSGILDLRTLQRPMYSDGSASTESEQISSSMQLLQEPDTPMNHTFGVDRETASKCLDDLQKIAVSHSQPIIKDEPPKGKDEPPKGKDEPPKGKDD